MITGAEMRNKPHRTDAMHDSAPISEMEGTLAADAMQSWLASEYSSKSENGNAVSGKMVNREMVTRLSGKRWARSLPDHGKSFVDAWDRTIANVAQFSDNPNLLPALEREAKADVLDSVEQLAGASRAVIEAWCGWYAKWADSVVQDLVNREPALFRTVAELAEAAKAAKLAAQDRRRELDRGAALFRWLAKQPDGFAKWEPDRIARALVPRGPVPRVRPMADALVRLGAAEWSRWPSGQLRALRLTGKAQCIGNNPLN